MPKLLSNYVLYAAPWARGAVRFRPAPRQDRPFAMPRFYAGRRQQARDAGRKNTHGLYEARAQAASAFAALAENTLILYKFCKRG
jgi:hypothetical protein